jgi:type IV pilus assembly protein PilA
VSRRRARQGGFSLIELLIVIIIIGILAAIAIPMFLSQRQKAKDAAVKEDIHSIQIGIQSYAADNNDTYPPSGSVAYLKGTQLDQWPQNAFSGGDMTYSATASPGSYSYTSTGTAAGSTYVLTGWLSSGSFTVPGGPADPLTASFTSTTNNLIALELAYFAKHGSWPRSWAPYNYTDLGLDPAAYASPINGLTYSAGGSFVNARPAPGYVMTVTDVSGKVRVMTSNLMWNITYDATSGSWYYHTTNPSDQIDISTLKVTPA